MHAAWAARCGRVIGLITWSGIGLSLSGCVPMPPPDESSPVYNNTTDPTNNGAHYISAAACGSCHSGTYDRHSVHGHANILTPILGAAPVFPAAAIRAGVPDPPDGFDWSAISYVIGGYTKKAQFLDTDGFVLTTGGTGAPTQWNLAFPPNGTTAGFVDYELGAAGLKPYDHSCFQCHTTGPMPQDPDSPLFQENRPGIVGTWEEGGVQCEACHGPGSNHIPNPAARDLYVNSGADQCGRCHSRAADPSVIHAEGGFIQNYQQWPEMLAGPHSRFDCTVCHSPHSSTTYDRDSGIRNECEDCHSDQNMAFHSERIYVRGEYSERLTCESCHMPYATQAASIAPREVVGEMGRMADTRTHIFRISTEPNGFETFFTDDGTAVREDPEGQAAVTVDFVCLRCHNGIGNAFRFSSISAAASTAQGLHAIGD